MTQPKPPFPLRSRRAYHEAGHALMAMHYGIEIFQVKLTVNPRCAGCYQTLNDFCRLTPERPVELAKLEQYIMFLMAGSISEMVAVERYHGIPPRSFRQRQFRSRWYQTAWLQPEWHLDLAYYCTAIWTPIQAVWEIPKRLKSLWLRTCNLVQNRQHWANIEKITAELAARKILDAGQLADALDLKVD